MYVCIYIYIYIFEAARFRVARAGRGATPLLWQLLTAHHKWTMASHPA